MLAGHRLLVFLSVPGDVHQTFAVRGDKLFGAGVHHCLGATIARVEGQEVFKALAERYPNLELKNPEMEYQPSITFRSIKELPVNLA